jgi:hypothetical protein
VKSRHYDIVRKETEYRLLWLEDAANLGTAKSRIHELASFWPGDYQVMDGQTHNTVAEVIGPADLLESRVVQPGSDAGGVSSRCAR